MFNKIQNETLKVKYTVRNNVTAIVQTKTNAWNESVEVLK
jgi:hypothetical protein